ncbi:hypothetical protein GRI38_04280 [Altererythrobacter aurantiacus]|uniref:Lipoprotein n=1 Tax=Parapontixanthobacter aurantiacus TaxID=1463599 RepID=A0A844ZE59_9SPHN|nr:hypothetical protein [Parapontixanthobacter aurantiacus]MXO85240.1 hypothetical protein [Parapontixanthobacter aurantiacus]
MRLIAAAVALATLFLTGCNSQADEERAYRQSLSAVRDIICASDRTDVSLGLEKFAVAAEGLDPETREATIDDIVNDIECQSGTAVMVPPPPEGFTRIN